MEPRKITASEAPRLYHSTRFCNIGPILKHGNLPGKATYSGRSDIFLSAVLTTGFTRKPWAEGDLREVWGHHDDSYESGDPINTSREGYKFDSGAAVVVDAQVATMEGCQFFISGSNAIRC